MNEKIADCGGETAVVLPTSSPHRMGPLAGICWTKSKSPLFFSAGGLQMTIAFHIHGLAVKNGVIMRLNFAASETLRNAQFERQDINSL